MLNKFWFSYHAAVAPLCERGLTVMVYLTRCVELATIHHYRKSQPKQLTATSETRYGI